MHTFLSNLLMVLLLLTSLFMIVLILIQRGKGGGLAGAFGGMGGQSAFGTKAGDKFTKFTAGVALFWIFLCMGMIWVLREGPSPLSTEMGGATDEKPGATAPASTEKPPAKATGETPDAPTETPASEEK